MQSCKKRRIRSTWRRNGCALWFSISFLWNVWFASHFDAVQHKSKLMHERRELFEHRTERIWCGIFLIVVQMASSIQIKNVRPYFRRMFDQQIGKRFDRQMRIEHFHTLIPNHCVIAIEQRNAQFLRQTRWDGQVQFVCLFFALRSHLIHIEY